MLAAQTCVQRSLFRGTRDVQNERGQANAAARCGCSIQIGINVASVTIFFVKYLQSSDIPPLKRAERNFVFVFSSRSGCVC